MIEDKYPGRVIQILKKRYPDLFNIIYNGRDVSNVYFMDTSICKLELTVMEFDNNTIMFKSPHENQRNPDIYLSLYYGTQKGNLLMRYLPKLSLESYIKLFDMGIDVTRYNNGEYVDCDQEAIRRTYTLQNLLNEAE